MNLLDMIGNYQNDQSIPDATPPAQPIPAGPQGSMAAPPGPNVADLLAKAMAPSVLPASPAPNTDSILPLMLMRFASQVTQPKTYGQSTANAILSSGSGALEYADSLKRQAEDRARQDLMDRQKVAESEARIQNERVGTAAKVQSINQETQRAPLELDRLRAMVEGAKNEAQLRGAEARLKTIQGKYADQVEQATIAEKNARTDELRAQAAMERRHAELYLKQTEEMLNLAKAKRAEPTDNWKDQGGTLPGDRRARTDTKTGTTQYYPMDPEDALAKATRDAQAEVDAGVIPKTQMAERKRKFYDEYRQGTITQMGAPTTGNVGASASGQPGTAKSGAPAPAAPQAPAAPNDARPNDVMQGKDGRLWVVVSPGSPMREISRSEFDSRKQKPVAGPESQMSLP